MQHERAHSQDADSDPGTGRVVSVAGSKAIIMLDHRAEQAAGKDRPEMGTLLAVETSRSVVLATISALSIPVPAQMDTDNEFWFAELSLVGELKFEAGRRSQTFTRGTSSYPALGDRVRLATHDELQTAFSSRDHAGVRVGSLRQDESIAVNLNVDELLGKHFAILGSTGTGKSCTTALILRSILERNPAAHIVLIDPHSEYATAFQGLAEVISPGNLQLPLWMLNFEETVEIFVPDCERKAEIEILAELIPIAKARFAAGRAADSQRLRRAAIDPGRCTVDAPLPYRVSDLLALIDERMGRLENKRELQPYRQLRQRIEAISMDGRYGFLFRSLTVSDDMSQVLGRLFRVPLRDKPLTILELTGLPSEVVNVVVAVLCRLTFEFALWSDGNVPVTLVCEEAHRYVPASTTTGFEPCKRAIAKIAKEGRKYGASLCIVTQRPSEIDPTILSQCNTVFALRLSNDRDQEIVASAITDTSIGLLDFLPALGKREALAFGDGVALPVRIMFDALPADALPRSTTAMFTERWQSNHADEHFLSLVVERWRAASMVLQGSVGDPAIDSFTEMLRDDGSVAEANPPAAEPGTLPSSFALPANALRQDGGATEPAKSAHLTLRERLLRPQGLRP
jgi:DNA helicase HerA-like ATPase